MCKAHGKEWSNYWQNKGTQEYVEELATSLGIPRDQLVSQITNGPNALRGTYVHPQVAIDLARWCSPRFAVMVTGWVNEILTTGHVDIRGAKAKKLAKLGRGPEWVEERLAGVAQRNEYTDTLKAHGVTGAGYAQCTNALYAGALGGDAPAIRAAKGLPAGAVVRNFFDAGELAQVRLSEHLARDKIAGENLHGNGQCAAASRIAGAAVATAVKLARETPVR